VYKKMVLAMVVFLGILSAGCISDNGDSTAPVVELVYMSGCGNMPSALSNDLIDAYIAWQPNVAIAEVAEIGKVISYSKDLPPEGKWHDHPCCVINVHHEFAEEHYDVAKYLTMLFVVSSDYVQENPDVAAQAAAQWIFGNQDLTFGNIVVSSLDVEMASLPTINFTTTPTEAWEEGLYTFVNSLEEIEMVDSELKGKTDAELKEILLHDTLYDDAIASLDSQDYLMSVPEVDGIVDVNLGYLAADDHDTALFVAAYEWE
jgi:NitT/TauT family transport system substrate-binding protein